MKEFPKKKHEEMAELIADETASNVKRNFLGHGSYNKKLKEHYKSAYHKKTKDEKKKINERRTDGTITKRKRTKIQLPQHMVFTKIYIPYDFEKRLKEILEQKLEYYRSWKLLLKD